MVYKRKELLPIMNILVDIDKINEFQGFVKVDIVRNLRQIKVIHHNHSCVMNNVGMNVSNFIDRLIEFESGIERKFTEESKYKARFGIIIDVLLPKGEWSDAMKKRLVSKYVKYLIGEEKQLKYISWNVKKSKRQWLKIYISDREFYPQNKPKTYTRDLYMNSVTKSWCKSTDDNAVKIASKGEIKVDSEGNAIYESIAFKKKKSRRFCYKDEHKEAFLNSFKEFFIQALIKCKCSIERGKFFIRMNLRKAVNPEQRRIIVAVNKCMQYIQNQLNIEYQRSLVYNDVYSVAKDGGYPGEKRQGVHTKKWLIQFDKYRLIFRNKVLVLEDEVINLNGRCDMVENAAIRLKEIFDEELQSIKYEAEVMQ